MNYLDEHLRRQSPIKILINKFHLSVHIVAILINSRQWTEWNWLVIKCSFRARNAHLAELQF